MTVPYEYADDLPSGGITPTRCRCGRRLLVTANRVDCVRCMKSSDACRCDDLTQDADGWGEIAFLPAGKYRVVAAPGGWSVESKDDGGAFT